MAVVDNSILLLASKNYQNDFSASTDFVFIVNK